MLPISSAELGFLGLRRAGEAVIDTLDVVLFGIPHDHGAEGRPGVDQGPASVRRSSWTFGPYSHALGMNILEELAAIDAGDLADQESVDRDQLLKLIEEKTFQLARGGQVPGLIGGSQLVTLGALRGLRRAKRRAVSLLHITAKNRCRANDPGEAGLLYCAYQENLLRDGGVLQVGVRGPSREGAETQRALSYGFERLTMDDVRWDIHGSMETIRSRAAQGALYVSVDLSALDVSVCPGVSRPSPGGLSCWEVQQILRASLGADIVGFDVVGLCPPADVSDMTAIVAVSILHELLGVIAEGRSSSRSSWIPGSSGRSSA
jgi:arginase family enzyme